MAQYTLTFSAILLVCIGFGDAIFENKVYWTPSGLVELDRSSLQHTSNGYYAKSTDTTTFTVDYDAYLTQIVLPELLHMNKQGKAVSFDGPIEAAVAIIDPVGSIISQQIVDITPHTETKVVIAPEIHLKADSTYQIVVQLPAYHIYAFNGQYSHERFNVQSRLGYGKLKVRFVEFSHGHKIENIFNRSPSVGMVKKIQLNRHYE